MDNDEQLNHLLQEVCNLDSRQLKLKWNQLRERYNPTFEMKRPNESDDDPDPKKKKPDPTEGGVDLEPSMGAEIPIDTLYNILKFMDPSDKMRYAKVSSLTNDTIRAYNGLEMTYPNNWIELLESSGLQTDVEWTPTPSKKSMNGTVEKMKIRHRTNIIKFNANMPSDEIEEILNYFWDITKQRSSLKSVTLFWTANIKVYELLKGVECVNITIAQQFTPPMNVLAYTLNGLQDVKRIKFHLGFGIPSMTKLERILLETDTFKKSLAKYQKDNRYVLDLSRYEEVEIPHVFRETFTKNDLQFIKYGTLKRLITHGLPSSEMEFIHWGNCGRIFITCGNPMKRIQDFEETMQMGNVFISLHVLEAHSHMYLDPIRKFSTGFIREECRCFVSYVNSKYTLYRNVVTPRCKKLHVISDVECIETMKSSCKWTDNGILSWISRVEHLETLILEGFRDIDLTDMLHRISKSNRTIQLRAVTFKNCILPFPGFIGECRRLLSDPIIKTEGCTILQDQTELWNLTKVYIHDRVAMTSYMENVFRISQKLIDKKKNFPGTPLPNCGFPLDVNTEKVAMAYTWIDLSGLDLWNPIEIRRCHAFSKEYGLDRYVDDWKLLDGQYPGKNRESLNFAEKNIKLALRAIKKSEKEVHLSSHSEDFELIKDD